IVEPARLTHVDEASRIAPPLGAQRQPLRIFYERQRLNALCALKIVLEAPHRTYRDRHADKFAELIGPASGGIDEGVRLDLMAARELRLHDARALAGK